jgi:cellulose synthase/poly-beta-1,6-N-acetylglucosamine synthase-like glycosyltransferase
VRSILIDCLWTMDVIMIVFMLGNNMTLALLALVGWRASEDYVRRRALRDYDSLSRSPLAVPISIVAPAFNEELSITDSVKGLLACQYAEFEVLVVNDGSTDSTMALLQQEFNLVEIDRVPRARMETKPVHAVYTCPWDMRLTVIAKENGGKADALNTGIAYAQYPLFCAIDADTMLDPRALSRLAWEFQARPDSVAAGGIVRVINGSTVSGGRLVDVKTPTALLLNIQILEYLRAFLLGRIAWSRLGMLLIISGAFGLFRREAVIDIGGYDTTSIGEDAELILRLYRHRLKEKLPCRIAFFPDPICWTEAPGDWKSLIGQRDRWQRGLIQMLFRHRQMILNPRYGRIGLLAIPYFLIFEMLGPNIEVLGYAAFIASVVLGIAPLSYTLSFIALATLFGLLFSVASMLVEERSYQRYPGWRDLRRLAVSAIAENFGYRQILSLVRVRSWWMLARKTGWGTIERSGFGPPPGPPPVLPPPILPPSVLTPLALPEPEGS